MIFTDPAAAGTSLAALRTLHEARDVAMLAATVMPDHVHMLLTLGGQLQLGQVMAKFKTLARDRGRVSWRWQQESFEHRLREFEAIESYAFYVFMNPYCAGLLTAAERWPWWYCPDPERFLFLSMIRRDERIPDEWIQKSDAIAAQPVVHS